MPVKRIIIHWTAGAHAANHIDLNHYHEVIEGDGAIVKGTHTPEDNDSTADGHYAAHTRNLNTDSFGLSLCAMSGAQERPFDAGKWPITGAQVTRLYERVAELCFDYDLEVKPETVLTHAEVERVYDVAQSGKWDITWLPHMTKTASAEVVGNLIRQNVQAKLQEMKDEEEALARDPDLYADREKKSFWARLMFWKE